MDESHVSRPSCKIPECLPAACAALAVLLTVFACSGGDGSPYTGNAAAAESVRPDDTRQIAELFAQRRSGVEVEAPGTVERTLPDDLEGSRHQRLVVRLAGGQTILLSHNIDLAPRIPVQAGDAIRFRGDFEWNDRGGVVHWTHHDPRGRREGGFVEFRGQVYR